ncbi:DUF2290 domain-containing protein [Gemmatimonadota bacterium]
MLSPEQIRGQMETLTSDLIGLSLCDHQNFPSLRDLGHGLKEVGIRGKENSSFALRNVPYFVIYKELDRTQTYNIKMLDGALLHMMYRFRDNQVQEHRLAFFPSPDLEEFQNNPKIYLENEVFAEVTMKNIVPFPLRFDFDCREGVVVEINHPKSHLTLGQYKNCRIPVSAPLTPYHFIDFILRNFYNTAFKKYCENITNFEQCFEDTIADCENKLIFIHIPVRQLEAV